MCPRQQFKEEKRPSENLELWLKNLAEYKQAQVKLTKEHDLLSAVLDATDTMVVVIDSRGRIVYCNHPFMQVTGFSLSEAERRYMGHMFTDCEEVEDFKTLLHNFTSAKLPRSYRKEWVTDDGDHLSIKWTSYALFDGKSAVEYLVLTGSNVTKKGKDR